MRTNIEIDDELLRLAQEATGLKTKRAVVEEGLHALIRRHRQVAAFDRLKGSAPDWEGDIDAWRRAD
jgi:Arc/MetJ family transcription regulator